MNNNTTTRTKRKLTAIAALLIAATLVAQIGTIPGPTTALAIPLYDHIWRIQYPTSNQVDLLCISNTLPNGNLSGFLVSNYAGIYRVYNTISGYYNENTSSMWFFANGPLFQWIYEGFQFQNNNSVFLAGTSSTIINSLSSYWYGVPVQTPYVPRACLLGPLSPFISSANSWLDWFH
jgi:hypothetical protein